ncbi:MAG TPA: phosphatase PAP2 family protein [Longimicrobium sp.]|nr:phosphatase PAP2 family protein [Longimicrobium sp.]
MTRLLALLFAILALAPARAHAQERAEGDGRAAWAAAGAGLLAGAILLDRTVDGAVPDGGGTRWEWASDALNYGGRPHYAVALLGAAYAGGRLAEAPEVSRAAAHVGAALLAAGAANGALKYALGRERPSATDDNARFAPFTADNRWQSFPSGHAVVAFSLAASVSEEARRPWVTALTYGGAALVGWSRVYEDKHWTSDVVGGALVGIAAGRGTVRLLHRARDEDADGGARLTLLPNGFAVTVPTR